MQKSIRDRSANYKVPIDPQAAASVLIIAKEIRTHHATSEGPVRGK